LKEEFQCLFQDRFDVCVVLGSVHGDIRSTVLGSTSLWQEWRRTLQPGQSQ